MTNWVQVAGICILALVSGCASRGSTSSGSPLGPFTEAQSSHHRILFFSWGSHGAGSLAVSSGIGKVERIEQSQFSIPIFYTRNTTRLMGKPRAWVAATEARKQAEAKALKQALAILAQEEKKRKTPVRVVSYKVFLKKLAAPLVKRGLLLGQVLHPLPQGSLTAATRP